MSVVATTKRLLARDAGRIRLHDAVCETVRDVVASSNSDQFSVGVAWSDDEFRTRIAAYDDLFAELSLVEALLAFWGNATSRTTLTVALCRLVDSFGGGGGNTGWLALRWYPAASLLYAGGVSALAAGRYDNLWALLDARIATPNSGIHSEEPLASAIPHGMNSIPQSFKLLPDLGSHHTPLSDHLFSLLEPRLNGLFCLGSDYERAFDRFEILYSLESAHRNERGWGPIGRFGWKAVHRESSPLHLLLAEAHAAATAWPPLLAGFFGGSAERFAVVSQQMGTRLAQHPMY